MSPVELGNAFLEAKRTVSGEVAFGQLDYDTFAAMVGASRDGELVTVRCEYRDPSPRCLWGWRRGFVQVGSREDEENATAEIHNARLRMTVDPNGIVSGATFEAVA